MGSIVNDNYGETKVQSVQVYAVYVSHTCYMRYSSFSVGNEVYCQYDELRRRKEPTSISSDTNVDKIDGGVQRAIKSLEERKLSRHVSSPFRYIVVWDGSSGLAGGLRVRVTA
jgi:hypothetical protein